jgi:NTE family protein
MRKARKGEYAPQAVPDDAPTKVVIACQGGGIHAAFAVGVLIEILKELGQERKRFNLVGISGTSAGALCALMVWYGLARKNNRDGSPAEAIDKLAQFWNAFAANSTAEKVLNLAAYSAFKVREIETPILGLAAPVFRLNPRGAIIHAVTAALPFLGVRRAYFDLDNLLEGFCPDFQNIDWDRLNTRLLVGATDTLNGIETVFDSQKNMSEAEQTLRNGTFALPDRIWRERCQLSLRGVAASGTLPELRQAERIDGRPYWDGLYSLNPPIREFWENVKKEYMPNEIWVIRINPQQAAHEPQSHAEIEDRQNELMGNLALNKELDFIAHMKLFLEHEKQLRSGPGGKAGTFPSILEEHFEEITIRTIKMTQTTCADLRYATKFDRSRGLIGRLCAEGRQVGRNWLSRWPAEAESYPQDAGHWPPRP